MSIQTPLTVSIQAPLTVSMQTPLIVSIQTSLTVSIQTPLTVSIQTPLTVSIQTPLTVSIQTPLTVSIQTPLTVSIQTPLTVSIQTPLTVFYFQNSISYILITKCTKLLLFDEFVYKINVSEGLERDIRDDFVHFTFQIFNGNSDRYSVVRHHLDEPIISRYIRLHPETWHIHISMRVELYGCKSGKFLEYTLTFFPNPFFHSVSCFWFD